MVFQKIWTRLSDQTTTTALRLGRKSLPLGHMLLHSADARHPGAAGLDPGQESKAGTKARKLMVCRKSHGGCWGVEVKVRSPCGNCGCRGGRNEASGAAGVLTVLLCFLNAHLGLLLQMADSCGFSQQQQQQTGRLAEGKAC